MVKRCSRFFIYVDPEKSAIFLSYFDDRSLLDKAEEFVCNHQLDWRVVNAETLLGNVDDFLFRYPDYTLITRTTTNTF